MTNKTTLTNKVKTIAANIKERVSTLSEEEVQSGKLQQAINEGLITLLRAQEEVTVEDFNETVAAFKAEGYDVTITLDQYLDMTKELVGDAAEEVKEAWNSTTPEEAKEFFAPFEIVDEEHPVVNFRNVATVGAVLGAAAGIFTQGAKTETFVGGGAAIAATWFLSEQRTRDLVASKINNQYGTLSAAAVGGALIGYGGVVLGTAVKTAFDTSIEVADAVVEKIDNQPAPELY